MAPWQVTVSFLCSAAVLLIAASRYFGAYPLGAAVGAAAGLGLLAHWYRGARPGDEAATRQTLRKLSVFVLVVLLVVPVLIRLWREP